MHFRELVSRYLSQKNPNSRRKKYWQFLRHAGRRLCKRKKIRSPMI
jgi:hypothetical protein